MIGVQQGRFDRGQYARGGVGERRRRDCAGELGLALMHVSIQGLKLPPFQSSAQRHALGHHASVQRGFKFRIPGKKALHRAVQLGKKRKRIGQATPLLVEKRGQLRHQREPVTGIAEGRLQFGGIDRHDVALRGQQQGEGGPAFLEGRLGGRRQSVVEAADAIHDGTAGTDRPAVFQLPLDDALGKAGHPPARGDQPRADHIGKLEPSALVGLGAQPFAETHEIIEAEHILGMIPAGQALLRATIPGMDERPDAEQELVGFEVARIVEALVDLVAVEKALAREGPDARQENP